MTTWRYLWAIGIGACLLSQAILLWSSIATNNGRASAWHTALLALCVAAIISNRPKRGAQ